MSEGFYLLFQELSQGSTDAYVLFREGHGGSDGHREYRVSFRWGGRNYTAMSRYSVHGALLNAVARLRSMSHSK